MVLATCLRYLYTKRRDCESHIQVHLYLQSTEGNTKSRYRYTDRHYSHYIPAAIHEFRKNGIDHIVKKLGLDDLGNYIVNVLAQFGSSHASLKRSLTKSAKRSRKKRKQQQDEQSMSLIESFEFHARVNTKLKQAAMKTIHSLSLSSVA